MVVLGFLGFLGLNPPPPPHLQPHSGPGGSPLVAFQSPLELIGLPLPYFILSPTHLIIINISHDVSPTHLIINISSHDVIVPAITPGSHVAVAHLTKAVQAPTSYPIVIWFRYILWKKCKISQRNCITCPPANNTE